ncbi:MAG: metal ABC transporter permease [Dehalococcoidia bacterium]
MQYGQLALLVLTTVIAIKVVGIVLVVALLVTPAATARLLVRRVPAMMALGALIGAAATVTGLYVSYYANVASGAASCRHGDVPAGAPALAAAGAPGRLAAGRRVRRAAQSS